MNLVEQQRKSCPAPLGDIEPHANLLVVPGSDQLLYKLVTIENLLRSISGEYLYFNRVDSYSDFPGADHNDGKQPPADRQINKDIKFEKAQHFSAADYYDQCRARTYACCFGLENTDYLWSNYANDSVRGKACIVFNFEKLRARLNQNLSSEHVKLNFNGIDCRQIFSLNYGVVEYVDWDRHQLNTEVLPNPIMYTYLKGMSFKDENELRISLSAPGLCSFELGDGRMLEFPSGLSMHFDFRAALCDGTIQEILFAQDSDLVYLREELLNSRIVLKPDSDL